MGATTNFNQSPYFDDYRESDNYHRILFKPAVAIQARELTQLQTILQNQVERFGNNILVEGTIIQGGNFMEERSLPYVKVRDIGYNTSGGEVATDVNQYNNMKAVGLTTGVEGIIIATEYGLESQAPDLSTLFVRYTKGAISGSNTNVRTFSTTEEIQLYSKNASGLYVNPFHKLTVAGTVDAAAIGTGYGVRCGNGIIYQKGHFIRFVNALTIVTKYHSIPDNLVVGFKTDEFIIDSNADSRLLDNANGFNNENAPGADRLQLIPSLVVKTNDEADADEKFFSVQEYANGRVVRRKLTTQYNVIEKQLEERTAEESGNYVIKRFNVAAMQSQANTENLSVLIGAGLGYVEGKRVELLNTITIDIPEASTFVTAKQQDINANYGSYVVVNGYSGRYDFTTLEAVNLKNAGGTTIGTARIRCITRQTATQYRLYLFMIVMGAGYSFVDTRQITANVSGGVANTVLVSNNTVLVDGSFNRAFFPIGKSFVKSINASTTDFVYRTSNTQSINTQTFNINLTGTTKFPYTLSGSLNSDERNELMVISHGAGGAFASGNVISVSAASLDGTGQVLSLTLSDAPPGSVTVTTYFNAKKTSATINQKTLETVYVKVYCANNTGLATGTYNLGIPDVYSIEGAWKVANTVANTTWEGYASGNSATGQVKTAFALSRNQFDDRYGHSGVRKVGVLNITTADKIIFKLKVLKKDAQPGDFYTVDSYPVDDTTLVLPDDKIRTENIPTYASTSGVRYDLRDVIDLRPMINATAAYTATPSAATINPSAAIAFGSIIYPAPNKTIETTYSYYLGRNDLVVADKNGEFEVVQGTPAETPKWPTPPTKGMVLARLAIPPYPSLPAFRANAVGKLSYGVAISSDQNRGYTMEDIGAIEKRINRLEYYSSLSLLETAAKDFLVTDVNGLDRFKNGIFVDAFDNLALADVTGGEFSAAIDPTTNDCHPKIRQYPLGLKVKTMTSVTRPSIKAPVTLTSTQAALPSASQKYATAFKNCTTGFYKYSGTAFINPEYDSGPDTVRAPDMNINIDLATPFVAYNAALAEMLPAIRTTTINNTINPTAAAFGSFGAVGGTTTTTTTTTNSLAVTGGGAVTKAIVGDFVTDVNFSPFMRSKVISIKVVGLRPNTRFYFYFDGVNVDEHVAKAIPDTTDPVNIVLKRASLFGGPNVAIISDANGTLYAMFRIPEETFYVGDRELNIIDINNLNSLDAITSSATVTYSGFNFSSAESRVSTITRQPAIRTATTVNTTTSFVPTPAQPRPPVNTGGWGGGGGGGPNNGETSRDPLAQTFIVDKSLSSDTNVFLSKVDLYFAQKSAAGKGVTIQLREVVNGYPSGNIIPFSSVHLPVTAVNAPTATIANNALTKTVVNFEAPVPIKTDTEYAIVILPDGSDPDYLVWISRTGEKDVDSGIAITQDTNAGMIFTSTNNSTWTPYQNENLKFTLYVHRFNSASGTLVMTNDDHEFFEIENKSGRFKNDESVFLDKVSFLAGNVSITDGSSIINGTGTTFTTQYNVGEHIVIKVDASNYEVLQVRSIANNTYMTTADISTRTASNIASHFVSPVGQVIYQNDRDYITLVLEKSTAKSSGFKFANTNGIRGEQSNSTADIVRVFNLPISYIQPNIYRSNFTKTRTTLKATKLHNGVNDATQKDMQFNDTTYLNEGNYYIKSKSNDFASSGFDLTVNLLNSSISTKDTSPVIDHEISNVMVGEYIVNNISTADLTERTTFGDASAKYVSRKIQLADGMDATDVKLILAGYRPSNTEIRVYAKFQSGTDNRAHRDVSWTKLKIKDSSAAISSIANRYDYREMEFGLDNVVLGDGEGAYDANFGNINYKDPTGALYTNYKYFSVKILMLATGHGSVPRIKDLRVIAVT